MDIFAHDILLIPRHNVNHWTLIVVNNLSRTISYYDSLRLNDGEKICGEVYAYLSQEYSTKKGRDLPWDYAIVLGEEKKIQTNSYDCGVHVCKWARSFIDDKWDAASCTKIRKDICSEIITGTIDQALS